MRARRTEGAAPFDEGLLWCEAPRQFANQRGLLLNEIVRQLSILSFVWGAFESSLAIWRPPGLRSGKVRAARRFLHESEERTSDWKPPAGYERLLGRFLSRLRTLAFLEDRDLERLARLRDDDLAGQGLGAVYLIRNHLAHGSLLLPDPEGWIGSQEAPLCPCVVETSTRLVLLSMQMIADLAMPGALVDAYCSPKRDLDGPEHVPLHWLARRLHLTDLGAID